MATVYPYRIADFDLSGVDMLVGMDFFASRRVCISNNRHREYFTSNDGTVFDAAWRETELDAVLTPQPLVNHGTGSRAIDPP